MRLSQDDPAEVVKIQGVQFGETTLQVQLSDGRQVSLPFQTLSWLRWLYAATPEQREAWSIEPGGYAIYWDELDDGIEVEHLLGFHALK